ncbi:MAG TPA: hypothetical protein VFY24_05640 [Azospira sp.]|nr:hypothetical protein [Azospira sp.]
MNEPRYHTQRRRPSRAAVSLAVVLLLMSALPRGTIAAESALPPQALPLQGAAIDVAIEADAVVSPQARQLADRVAVTGDHAGEAFIIVDKKRASVLVFEPDARLRAHSAVLLGLALGDVSVPGIGTRPMNRIRPAERTTPAGRFVAERGRNTRGEDVIWVDYDAAVSMHRVRTTNPLERRAERLASPTVDDNRISYGCINVPVAFYDSFIRPLFARRKAMVYILPDLKSVDEVFGLPQSSTRTGSAAISAVPEHAYQGNAVQQ